MTCKHRITTERWGIGVGTPDLAHCRKEKLGQPCATNGAHIYVRCAKCGAIGVICPQEKRITWTEKEEY